MFAANEPKHSLVFLKGLCIHYFLIGIIPMERNARFFNISQLKPPFPLFLVQSCWNCGRKASETCSGCNTARYCGSFCQHKDWEKHHHVCGQTLQAQQQGETPATISSSATPSSGTGSPADTPSAATPRSATPGTPSAIETTPR